MTVVVFLAHGGVEKRASAFDFYNSNLTIYFGARAGANQSLQAYNLIAMQIIIATKKGADYIKTALETFAAIPTMSLLSKTHIPDEAGAIFEIKGIKI